MLQRQRHGVATKPQNLKDSDMTPQESQMLQDFLTQLTQAKGIVKDPEADALISAAVSRQPEAGYLLVQRSLLQTQALQNAQAQIVQLQSELHASEAAHQHLGKLEDAAAYFLVTSANLRTPA